MENEDISYTNIIYNINKENNNEINIFGYDFVKNNKNKCKMIIDNNEYEITEKYKIENYNNNKLYIKLKGIDNVTDMSYMFSGCELLSSLPDISKWNTNNVTNMECMFNGCLSLSLLPDISKWNTNNVTNMDAYHYYLYLIFQNGVLIMLKILVNCLIDAYHYYHYLIFLNGILIMLLI